MTDVEAVAGIRQGNERAFEHVYKTYKNRVTMFALRFVSNSDIAEEIAQEVFLKVHQKIDSFRGDSSFPTWLQAIAKTEALMYLRSNAKRDKQTVGFEDLQLSLGHDTHNDLHFDNSENIHQILMEDHRKTPDMTLSLELDHILRAVPPAKRKTFLLHYQDGYWVKEIAEMTGRSVSAVKSELARVRQRLKEVASQ